MKTLNNHTLIYDNECPMCNLYSKGFTQYGMLAEKGREAFTEISVGNKNLIDFDRAKNEIALIDHDHNKVVYGLDSLLLIIGNSFPTLAKIARCHLCTGFSKDYILLFPTTESRLFLLPKNILKNLAFLIII